MLQNGKLLLLKFPFCDCSILIRNLLFGEDKVAVVPLDGDAPEPASVTALAISVTAVVNA